MRIRPLAVVACSMLGVAPAAAQSPDSVPPERLAARDWYREARFGMFVHWGVYSLLGQGEWVMENRRIPVDSYEWLASTFNPVKFDAHAWVALAKAAGMRYITITSRHHDGFAMFGTKATTYNIVDWTPFGRDPLKALADECQRQGLKLFFYYSQLDWHHPDWRLVQTYALIHRLQPAALIIPNHHRAPLPGEDVQTFEQDLPGANTAGFNTTRIGSLPLETSLTMNDSWGFNITDRAFKSTRALIHYLVRAAGNDANLLLNIGPRPDGTIQPEAVERLRVIGAWLETYGTSIYGTRGGPVRPREWGVTTQRGDTVFVHVLDWPDHVLSLPAIDAQVVRATMLAGGATVSVAQTAAGVTLTLPSTSTDEPDRVVVLRTKPR
jgi:alpha-L-fucosidase